MHSTKKLTKKYFMQIPEGQYLVSNCYSIELRSVFEEYIGPIEERDNQWKRIVKARAAQNLCRIFNNKEEYQKWLALASYNSSKKQKGDLALINGRNVEDLDLVSRGICKTK